MYKEKKLFSKIYDKFAGDIFRYVILKVNSKNLAEDITSEVFLKTWQYIIKDAGDLAKIEQIRPFLYRIACNSVIDHYRKKDKTAVLISGSEEESNEDVLDRMNAKNNLSQDLYEEYLKNDDFRQVKKAVDNLEDKYKDIVLLYFLEGFSHKEIAEITGKSAVSVRVGIHRSLKKVKEYLKL